VRYFISDAWGCGAFATTCLGEGQGVKGFGDSLKSGTGGEDIVAVLGLKDWAGRKDANDEGTRESSAGGKWERQAMSVRPKVHTIRKKVARDEKEEHDDKLR
jgi:hypothetical protein